MRQSIFFACLIGIAILPSDDASAQAPTARFELVDAAGLVSATVDIQRGHLIVHEANGERIFYSRASQYDSPDRRYVGYIHTGFNRVLRFPRSGQGAMLGVDLNNPAARFQVLSRTVRPTRGFASLPGSSVPPSTYAAPLQGLGAGGGLYAANPLGTGTLGTGYPAGVSPGIGLPIPRPALPLRRAPSSILLDSQIVPRPPLAPVTAKLFNGSRRELRVTVADLADDSKTQQYKLAPGAVKVVAIKRDAGADRVEHYRTVMFDGAVVTREVVRPIPPKVLYEIIVHEWMIQSIAIDRTGKSPNAIEDIHRQGRGIGRFPVPPGDQFKGGTIDVYQTAKNAKNPGAVAPIATRPNNAAEEPSGLSPLERTLLEQQRAASRER